MPQLGETLRLFRGRRDGMGGLGHAVERTDPRNGYCTTGSILTMLGEIIGCGELVNPVEQS
jgi:hypothetical protein